MSVWYERVEQVHIKAHVIAMSFVTSPTDINVPTRGLLAAKTDFFLAHLNNIKDVYTVNIANGKTQVISKLQTIKKPVVS